MEVDVAGKIIYNYGPSKNHGKLLENQMVRTINGDSFPFLVQRVLLTPSQWWDNQDNQAIELRWFSSELNHRVSSEISHISWHQIKTSSTFENEDFGNLLPQP